MKTELLYVELKQGHSGPAWIGYGQFSKSYQTVYFDGKVLKKGQGISGNHFDIETNEEYWISGVKKNGEDRHWAGGGEVQIDRSVLKEYLELTNQTFLPKNKYVLVDLNNVPNKELSREIENSKIDDDAFDENLLYKSPKDLSEQDLKKVIQYYSELNLADYPLKARKGYKEALNKLITELELREVKS